MYRTKRKIQHTPTTTTAAAAVAAAAADAAVLVLNLLLHLLLHLLLQLQMQWRQMQLLKTPAPHKYEQCRLIYPAQTVQEKIPQLS